MTNIEKLALDICRMKHPEKVMNALIAVLDVMWDDKPASSAQNDMDKALDAIEAVVPKMLSETKEENAA